MYTTNVTPQGDVFQITIGILVNDRRFILAVRLPAIGSLVKQAWSKLTAALIPAMPVMAVA